MVVSILLDLFFVKYFLKLGAFYELVTLRLKIISRYTAQVKTKEQYNIINNRSTKEMKIDIQNSPQIPNYHKSFTTKHNSKNSNRPFYNFPTEENESVVESEQIIIMNNTSKYQKKYQAELNKLQQFTNGKYQTNENNFGAVNSINHEMLEILKEENKNLKKQNAFLLNKIRAMIEKQRQTKELKQKLEQQKKKIYLLSEENQELRNQVFELTQLINNKAESIQIKLQHLFAESQLSVSNKLSIINPHQLDEVQTKRKSETATQSRASQQVQQLNSKFEELLYSCKGEEEKEKRKEIRKKLVQLTYKMRELRKQCN